MASALKRKRGPVEVMDTPKRLRAVKYRTGTDRTKISDKTGWEAAFQPPKTLELVKTNGASGNDTMSPEVMDYEDFEQLRTNEEQQEVDEVARDAAEKALRKAIRRKEKSSWKLSKPVGGRMINVDPVFTNDEEFLILATRTTINIYSTTTSLLHRSIDLKTGPSQRTRIVTYRLSPTYGNILWVACSNGSIFKIDWTSGAGTNDSWSISSSGCIHMAVASMDSGGRKRDVVFTTEVRSNGGYRITANELAPPNGSVKTDARTIYTCKERIDFLQTAKGGSVIVATSENRVLIGTLKSTDFDAVAKIKYEFRILESADRISTFDLRVLDRLEVKDIRKSVRKIPIVNVVVGDVRGSLFLYTDILAKLVMSQDGALPSGWSLTPKKLHWHRQEVQSVKWSRDGNYVISGGNETVLVLWQLDTGKLQFLPHLAAAIQNIVVSSTGSSYAIQLADNSAMVMSTAELEPIANIAGIQANVLQADLRSEQHIRRVEDETWGRLVYQHTPAVVSPIDPTKLLLAVGQSQEMRPINPLMLSSPYLQTFDIGSGRSVSKQALTRAHVTNINISPNAHRLSEPRVTHMKVSYDGTWLVTVDEWVPPKRDVDFLGYQPKERTIEQQSRREVFLKFWQWNTDTNIWELISRIDSPHSLENDSGFAGRVVDLATDSVAWRFATIGEDGFVRTWIPKTRKRDGVVVRNQAGIAAKNWQCEHAISLGKPELSESLNRSLTTGCVAFSEDGSILAAVHSNTEGVLHLLDSEFGTIRASRAGVFENNPLRMEFLGQDIIIMSDKLNVYDLVSEEVKSSVRLSTAAAGLSVSQKQEMFHLAVDVHAKTYAIAIPGFQVTSQEKRADRQSLQTEYTSTEIMVFDQTRSTPQFRETSDALVTALLPTQNSEGYLILDTTAELRTIMKRGTQSIMALAQSISAQKLDNEIDNSAGDTRALVDEVEDMEEYLPPTPALTQDDDEIDTPVVSQQQLAQIFDIGPAYALPPLEDMFYQVAGLFSGKRLVQGVN